MAYFRLYKADLPKGISIGIYWGNSKSDESNIFIKDFVDEVRNLFITGIDIEIIENKTSSFVHKNIIIDVFCCDMPAKEFILKIKSHTSFFHVLDVQFKENI